MKIKCTRSGGFIGRVQSCVIDTTELNDTEKKAFNELVKQSRKDELARDTYVYYFNFEENNSEKEVIMEETFIEENMMPFIQKINEKLKR